MSVGLEREAASMTFPRQYAATRRFSLGAPRTMSVIDDGATVLFLRSASGDDPVLRLWALDVASGEEQLLVDPNSLGAHDADLPAAERARRERARESAGGIVSYSVDRSGTLIAFALAGQLHVLDRSTNTVRQLPTAAGVFDPRIDPTGRRVAYVVGTGLCVQRLESGSGADFTIKDSEPLVSWGRADFVAAEEMGRSRGFWWSPDGSQILATRVSDQPVNRWFIADPAHPGTEPNEIRYPAAGTTNPDVALHLITIDDDDDGAAGPAGIDWSDNGRFEYLADVVWTNGHAPLVVRQTRDQRLVSVAELAQIASGQTELTELQTITDEVWVELIPGSPARCDAGLLTVEDRADHDRRMLCLNGTPISNDTMHVRAILGISADPQLVIVSAWTEPESIQLFGIDLATNECVPFSQGQGVHLGVVGGSTIVVVSNSLTTPGATVAVRSIAGAPLATISSTAARPLLDAKPTLVRLGERALPSVVLLPEDHDGERSLPILLDPYGGPHAQRVLASHDTHLVSQWFANQGFAVIVTDGAGTPGRGPAFEREVWGDLAGPVLEDQIAALDAAAELYPFIDLSRVGIRGWSFGGYLAALAVLRRPDRFHAAVAGAPVTTWHLYDTHYTERYLGHPDTYPQHYEQSDLLAEVQSGEGRDERPLLIIHGLADDNVVAAHTLQLSSTLLAAGRSHTVLPLSGVTHMTPQEVVAENLLHLQRDFLAEHLGQHSGQASPIQAAP